MKKRIFKITLKEWEKYNNGLKGHHKKSFIPHNIIHDARLLNTPTSHRWLFLALIMIAGDHGKDTVTMTEEQLNSTLSCRVGALKALDSLQSNQLLTYELVYEKPCLRESIERESSKSREPSSAPQKEVTPDQKQTSFDNHKKSDKPKPNTEANRKAWLAYSEAYFARYKVEPIRNAKCNTNISQFVSRVGAEDAPDILKFYLTHTDSYYLRNMHSLGLALKDAEALRTQWLKGQVVTSRDVRDFERKTTYQEQYDKIQKGEI